MNSKKSPHLLPTKEWKGLFSFLHRIKESHSGVRQNAVIQAISETQQPFGNTYEGDF